MTFIDEQELSATRQLFPIEKRTLEVEVRKFPGARIGPTRNPLSLSFLICLFFSWSVPMFDVPLHSVVALLSPGGFELRSKAHQEFVVVDLARADKLAVLPNGLLDAVDGAVVDSLFDNSDSLESCLLDLRCKLGVSFFFVAEGLRCSPACASVRRRRPGRRGKRACPG